MRGKTNSLTISGGSSENTLKNLLDARQSAQYLFFNYTGTSVNDLIAYNDTENVINTSNMFSRCEKLISSPSINISNVTTCAYMFEYCSSLTSVTYLNTANVTNMQGMFKDCNMLASIPLLNTSNVTNMSNMFFNCYNIKSLPLLDTSKCTYFSYVFYNCSSITSIPAFDVSKVTSFDSAFYRCSRLDSIHMTGMKTSFNISASTKFTSEALHEIITNLATVTSSKTLTMGSTNLAKVSDEYKTIATNKGWTLA